MCVKKWFISKSHATRGPIQTNDLNKKKNKNIRKMDEQGRKRNGKLNKGGEVKKTGESNKELNKETKQGN